MVISSAQKRRNLFLPISVRLLLHWHDLLALEAGIVCCDEPMSMGLTRFALSLQFPLPITLLFVHGPRNLVDFCHTDEPGLAHDRIGIEVGKQGAIFAALRG
jgi:hypothetical protein